MKPVVHGALETWNDLMMGSKQSTHKTVENDGTVNNNFVVVGNEVDVYSEETTILLGVLVGLTLFATILQLYKLCIRQLKKKYMMRTYMPSAPSVSHVV